MSKARKSAEELRAIVLAEAITHPVCPRDIDVVVRPDLKRGWIADIISLNKIAHADCFHWIGTTVQRLEYELRE